MQLLYTYNPIRNEVERVFDPFNLSYMNRLAKGYGFKLEDLREEWKTMIDVLSGTAVEFMRNYGDPSNIPYSLVPQTLYRKLEERGYKVKL